MSMWQIYWLTRLVDLGCASAILLVLTIPIFFIALPFSIGMFDQDWHSPERRQHVGAKRVLKISMIVSAFSLLVNVLAPSRTDLALMFAGSWVTNSEEMQKLPTNVFKTINDFLEDNQVKHK